MKLTTKEMTINAVIAALYVVLTTINPIGHGAIQIRISEMLCIIPFINRKFIPGILIGVTIANLFSPLGIVDVTVGLSCGIIAYTISYFIKNLWLNVLQYAIVCAIIVPIMLYQVAGFPYWPTFVAIFISTFVVGAVGAVILNTFKERLQLVN